MVHRRYAHIRRIRKSRYLVVLEDGGSSGILVADGVGVLQSDTPCLFGAGSSSLVLELVLAFQCWPHGVPGPSLEGPGWDYGWLASWDLFEFHACSFGWLMELGAL